LPPPGPNGKSPTPPRSRLDIIEKLPTLRGVLVEKPLGLTLQDSRAFLERCRKGGILVQVNYWRRADKVFRGLAAGRLETLIGRPQAVFGLYGNGLLNNGSHMIDFARMLFGEIETVDADRVTEISFTSAIADDIHTSFRLKMATGLVVSFQPLDFKHYRENGLDVWGEKGRLSIVQEGLALSLFPRGENRAMSGEREIASDHPQALETSVGSAFYEMYGNLADAVHGKEPLWSPGESAMSTARAVQAVFESEKSGQRIVSVE
jgi:predicted dehydrogenase